MCGRFVAAADPDGVARLFVVDERKEELGPSWNVAPTDPVRAVVEHDQRRYLVALRWGLVPHWAADERGAAKLINARAETVAEKPAFREALVSKRCIVPADGFYEWQTDAAGNKVPSYIHHPEGRPLALAGLWSVWRPQGGGEPLRTCTIITTAAAGPAADLHDRMPLILPPESWDPWLDRGLRDPAAVTALLADPEQELAHHRVAPRVNSPRHNGPELVEPAGA